MTTRQHPAENLAWYSLAAEEAARQMGVGLDPGLDPGGAPTTDGVEPNAVQASTRHG
jgi:hypothetical protein